MSAHFSSMYDQSSGLVQWSPDGRYVAMAVGKRLVVRDAMDSFEIVQVGHRARVWERSEYVSSTFVKLSSAVSKM